MSSVCSSLTLLKNASGTSSVCSSPTLLKKASSTSSLLFTDFAQKGERYAFCLFLTDFAQKCERYKFCLFLQFCSKRRAVRVLFVPLFFTDFAQEGKRYEFCLFRFFSPTLLKKASSTSSVWGTYPNGISKEHRRVVSLHSLLITQVLLLATAC